MLVCQLRCGLTEGTGHFHNLIRNKIMRGSARTFQSQMSPLQSTINSLFFIYCSNEHRGIPEAKYAIAHLESTNPDYVKYRPQA